MLLVFFIHSIKKTRKMVGHGFGGFGSGTGTGPKSPQEQRYFAISRSGMRSSTGASATVAPHTSSAGKRGVLRRTSLSTSLTPAASMSLSGLEATPTAPAAAAAGAAATPKARRTPFVVRTGARRHGTPQRRAHGHVRTSDVMFDGEDCSASAAASCSSARAADCASDGEDGDGAGAARGHCTLDDAAHAMGIDNDRDSCAPTEEEEEEVGEAEAERDECSSSRRVAELEHALEEARAGQERALAAAAERQAVCDALLAQVEGLRRRYFNALCLAVKLDRAAGAGACIAQDQQDLYDAAKLQGVSVDEYPAWVVRHLGGAGGSAAAAAHSSSSSSSQ